MLTVSLMGPVPLALNVAPAVPVAVQASDVMAAGKVSLTVAPTTFEGPPFLLPRWYRRLDKAD